jgi:hypothetical protein
VELKYRPFKILHSVRKKKEEKWTSIPDLWDTTKQSNIHIIGMSKVERRTKA